MVIPKLLPRSLTRDDVTEWRLFFREIRSAGGKEGGRGGRRRIKYSSLLSSQAADLSQKGKSISRKERKERKEENLIDLV